MINIVSQNFTASQNVKLFNKWPLKYRGLQESLVSKFPFNCMTP